MDISATFAARSYAAQKPATAPDPVAEAATGAARSFADTLHKADQTAQSAMVGGADAQSLVEALGQAKFAVDAAVTVRDKVVEAYQEILRMPV
jgi:flagellar hook-basal body complex protein FliE